MKSVNNKSAILLWVALLYFVSLTAEGSLDTTGVSPSQPTASSAITLFAAGTSSQMDVSIDFTNISRTGNNLRWDIYMTVGLMQILGNWECSRSIGVLEPGLYSLTTNAYARGPAMSYPYYTPYYLQDAQSMPFTVTPEPATLILFGLGTLTQLTNIRRKNTVK